jgi:sugar phosphate isomerase/epimerase
MKLAWTVATPDTRDASMLAWRGALAETFSSLAEIGYGGVDLMVRDPSALNPAEIDAAAATSGIRIAAVSTGQLRKEDGLSLNAADASERRRAVERSMAVVDLAARWGAQVNIGTLRGQLGTNREEGMRCAAESLARLTEHARTLGVTVAIEPQTRSVSNWLNTAAETVAWMGAWTDEPRILFDVYHALLEERSVVAALIRSRPFITYVQLSDSNRLAPGCGSLSFGDILRVLAALQYQGYLCVECRQEPNSAEAARRAVAHLQPLLCDIESGYI